MNDEIRSTEEGSIQKTRPDTENHLSVLISTLSYDALSIFLGKFLIYDQVSITF